MSLILSDLEQRQFTEAVRVLLSPFDEPVATWRAAVLDHLTRLLGADMGGFILPSSAEETTYTLHNLPDEFAREYFRTFVAGERGVALIQATESSIWSTRSLIRLANGSVEDWFRSRDYRAFYSRFGIQEGIGYAVRASAPRGSARGGAQGEDVGALLTCFRSVFGTESTDERSLAILRLLQPALEAGVAGRVRFAGLHGTLREALDAVSEGVQVYDASGRRVHANAALVRLLEDDQDCEPIRTAMERVSGALRALLRDQASSARGAEAATREVATARARYQVSGQLAGGGGGEAPTIIVCVVRLTPAMPSAEGMRERWGLSPQESRVALLLVRGLTNASIAAELQLSPATTRHYTETVFAKLGVHTRAAAVHRVLHG